MTLFFQGTAWYALLFAGGMAGFFLARRLFANAFAAWAAARLFGFGVPAFVAWYFGLAGSSGWAWVALPFLLVGAFLAAPTLRKEKAVITELEVVGFSAFWLLAVLRSPNWAVMGTEKPMDLAILASLMRGQPLPPEDPWFAGYPLPYYYWGFVPWILPARVSGFFPDEVFNLLVPTFAALTAQLAYAWARSWGLARPWGGAAAAATVFLGTADGWWQLLTGTAGFFSSNLWEASRGIAHTITEFPLFTFHLGDLHPHLLCQPWVLSSLIVWQFLAPLRWPWRVLVRAWVFGVAAATNPWTVPFLGLAVVLLSLAAPERRLAAALETVGASLLALVLFFPAWANLPAAASGLGFVHTPTTFGEIARVLLPALLPLVAVSVWFFHARHRLLGVPLAGLAFALLAVITGRPLAALAVTLGVALLWQATREASWRPAAYVLAACLLALIGMEVVYLRDPYGPEWYRMNTVFKTLSFVFLVVPVPSLWLLAQHKALGWRRSWLWAVVPWFLALPQLATVVRAAWPLPESFAGLHWMAQGEAEAAHLLHRSAAPEVLVEAVGDAYSDAARMSACSGVPTVLGWDNHEGLWRPAEFEPLIRDRRDKVQALYRCPDPACVQTLAQELGASLVVVGSVERRLYPELDEHALLGSGQVVFAQGEVTIVRVAAASP